MAYGCCLCSLSCSLYFLAMLYLILILWIFACWFGPVQSTPLDWNGVFSNIPYKGSIKVCVAQLNVNDTEVFIGMALISQRSYMRGIIYDNDTWVGRYWRAGGSIQGTFQLRLVDGGSSLATYSGEMSRLNGRTDRIYGFQTDYLMPSTISCFQTDELLIDTLSPGATDFNFSGRWSGWDVSSVVNNELNATYNITITNSSTNSVASGIALGALYEPLIWGFKWTDVDAYDITGTNRAGIGLAVAKSVNTFYCLMLPQSKQGFLYSELRLEQYHRHSISGPGAGVSGSNTSSTGGMGIGTMVGLAVGLSVFLLTLCFCCAGYCRRPSDYPATV